MHSAIQAPPLNADASSDNIGGGGGGVGRTTNYSRISSYLPHNIVIDVAQVQ